MTRSQRNLFSGCAAALVSALLCWVAPSPNYGAVGVLLPAKSVYQPVPASTVTQQQWAPINAQLVGQINIERRYGTGGYAEQKEIASAARKMAAQAGANVLVIKQFGVETVTSGHQVYVFRGTAYYSAARAQAVRAAS